MAYNGCWNDPGLCSEAELTQVSCVSRLYSERQTDEILLWSGSSVRVGPEKTLFCSAKKTSVDNTKKITCGILLKLLKNIRRSTIRSVRNPWVWDLWTEQHVSPIMKFKKPIIYKGGSVSITAGELKVSIIQLVSLYCRFVLHCYSNTSLLH